MGSSSRAEDVTRNYKPEEGTPEERAQIRHAVRQAVIADREDIFEVFKVKSDDTEDVEFQFSDLDKVQV